MLIRYYEAQVRAVYTNNRCDLFFVLDKETHSFAVEVTLTPTPTTTPTSTPTIYTPTRPHPHPSRWLHNGLTEIVLGKVRLLGTWTR